MADMDAVRAKSILDPFKHVFRAAEFLSEALDTAATAERRQGELKNNLEHLEKQQAEAQAALHAIEAAGVESQRHLAQQQAEARAKFQRDADRALKLLEDTRARIEEGITAAQARLTEYTQRAERTIVDLDRQIADKTRELEQITDAVEALRAQARQVLN